MITIEVKKDLKQICLKGHANAGDFGKDIVCAGVSAILETTVNAILSLNQDSIEFEAKNPFVLKVKKEDKVTRKLLENMMEMFESVAMQYPKNVTIRKEE